MKTTSSILFTLITAFAAELTAQQPGNLDSTFGVNGWVVNHYLPEAYSIAFQEDGKIVVAGVGLFRYNYNGSIDSSFGWNGAVGFGPWASNYAAYSVAIQPDGKIVVGGSPFAIARFNTDGTTDSSFGTNGLTLAGSFCGWCTRDPVAYSIVIQPDGKILAGGDSFVYDEHSDGDFALARFNADGTLDSSFSSDGKLLTHFTYKDDRIKSIALQPDGKIVAAGYATDPIRHGYVTLARYNSDGSLDSTFSNDGKLKTSITGIANAVVIQPDGNIIIAGHNYLGNRDFIVARFKPDGAVDSSFNISGIVYTDFGIDYDVAASAVIQRDGKIVAAGWAGDSPWAGSPYYSSFAVARYNTTGTLDTTFNSDGKVISFDSTFLTLANAVGLQFDGKIVVAGGHRIVGGYVFAATRFISGLSMPMVNIEGHVLTEQGVPIADVEVILNGQDYQIMKTDTTGHYSFIVTEGGNYTSTPSKSNDIVTNNGITSIDALFMRRHILGTPLSSPYKIIAAAEVSADGDTTITTQDILFTRSLILGNITSFPINRLWQFVSSDYVFPDASNPFPFDKTRTYTNITTNQTNQNFIGIKLGDVNGSWDPNIP